MPGAVAFRSNSQDSHRQLQSVEHVDPERRIRHTAKYLEYLTHFNDPFQIQ